MTGIAFSPAPVFICKAAAGLKPSPELSLLLLLICPKFWTALSLLPLPTAGFCQSKPRVVQPSSHRGDFLGCVEGEGWKELSAASPQEATESCSALSQWGAPWGELQGRQGAAPLFHISFRERFCRAQLMTGVAPEWFQQRRNITELRSLSNIQPSLLQVWLSGMCSGRRAPEQLSSPSSQPLLQHRVMQAGKWIQFGN